MEENSLKKGGFAQVYINEENKVNLTEYQGKYIRNGERISKNTIINRALKVFFSQVSPKEEYNGK